MKKITILLVLIALGCSKDNVFIRPMESFNLSFNIQVPSETSKVPSCKAGEPTEVSYTVVNARNETFVYFAPVENINGMYGSVEDINLPIGEYTITDIDLVNEGEILYSVPTAEDEEVRQFSDLLVPIDISLTDDVNISGTAFCYNVTEAPVLERIINDRLGTSRLSSLYFLAVETNCTKSVRFAINEGIFFEVFISQPGTYEVAIPETYESLNLSVRDENGIELDFKSYTSEIPYQSTELLIFNYNCG